MAADVFDVVFDIATAGLPEIPLALFGVALVSVITLVLFLFRRRGWWLGLVFLAAWTGSHVAFVFVPNLQLKDAAASGRCERVEGVVTDYILEPYGGRGEGERFKVSGREFEYSHFMSSPGYRRTVAHGGVHLAGRHVRLCAVGNDIVRLEARRQEWPEALSTVSFRLTTGDDLEFSKNLYGVTQRERIGSYPIVWAKDFALSDYDLTFAGECAQAVTELEPIIAAAAKGIGNESKIVADYRASAKCQRSSAPPERSWRAPPQVLFYQSDSGVSMVPSDGSSSATSRFSLLERAMEARARHVTETCARSQSCAQRTDRDAKGYSGCVGKHLILSETSQIGSDVVSYEFRCDLGEGYLFRVVVHGLTGPAYEDVYQCSSGCGAEKDAFAPEA